MNREWIIVSVTHSTCGWVFLVNTQNVPEAFGFQNSILCFYILYSIFTAGSDYDGIDSTFTFFAGSPPGSRVSVPIDTLNDNIAETSQTFTVTLTSETPDVFTVADEGGLVTVTIIDDEGMCAMLYI